MNFLRTMKIDRLVDQLKLLINGEVWTSQSTMNVVAGRNMTFAQVETKDTSTFTVSCGINGKLGFWGGFLDTTTQSAASTTASYVITLNTSDANNDGVTVVSGSRLTVSTGGVYNICTSIQFQNADTSIHDATFWFRKNGTDIANSSSYISVPNSHGGTPGNIVSYVDLPVKLAAGDYVELAWCTNSTNITLATIPSPGSPTRPVSPSVLVTVHQI